MELEKKYRMDYSKVKLRLTGPRISEHLAILDLKAGERNYLHNAFHIQTDCLSGSLTYPSPSIIRVPRSSGPLVYPDPSFIRTLRLSGSLAYPDPSLIRIVS